MVFPPAMYEGLNYPTSLPTLIGFETLPSRQRFHWEKRVKSVKLHLGQVMEACVGVELHILLEPPSPAPQKLLWHQAQPKISSGLPRS